MKVLVAIIIIIDLIILWPLLLIWSLNTLFGLTIAYCIKTWIAALIITVLFAAKGKS